MITFLIGSHGPSYATPRLAHPLGAACYQEDLVFKCCVQQRDLFDEALARAQARNRPLLLVVGYDGCAWSRAMMNILLYSAKADAFREAFEIQTIAASRDNLTGKELITDLMRSSGQDPEPFLKAVPLLVIVDPSGRFARAIATKDLERNDEATGTAGQDLEKVEQALLSKSR